MVVRLGSSGFGLAARAGGGSVSHIVCYYALASDRLLFIVVYTDALCVVLFPAVAGRVE